jgi:hypothetical protein
MLGLLVLKEVVNPFLFHEPTHEIEVGFPVLDAIVTRRIIAGQAELKFSNAATFENILKNLWHGFVLENTTIGIAREQPEPWHNGGAILRIIPVGGYLRKTADVPMEISLALGSLQADASFLADDIVKVDPEIVAREFGLEAEGPAKFLVTGKRRQAKNVRPEGGVNADKPVLLLEIGHG